MKTKTSGAVLAVTYALYALLVIMLTPSLVSGMVSELAFSLQQAAEVISGSMLGATVVTLIVLTNATKIRFRRYFASGIVAIAVADLFAALLVDPLHVTLTFILRGFGGGLVVATAFIFFARDPRKEGIFAVLLGAQLILAALGIYYMPTLMQTIGWGGLFVCACIIGVVLFVSSMQITNNTVSAAKTENPTQANLSAFSWLTISVTLCLTSYLLHFVANTAIWTFFEQIGNALGFQSQAIADALALSMIVGGIMAIVPIVLGTRYGRSRPLLSSIGLILISALLLIGQVSELWYFMGAAIYNTALSIGLPYYQGLLAELDPSGRALTVSSLIGSAGWIIGPLLGALLEAEFGFDGMLMGMAGIFAVALILVAPMVIQADRRTISL